MANPEVCRRRSLPYGPLPNSLPPRGDARGNLALNRYDPVLPEPRTTLSIKMDTAKRF